MNNIPRSSMPGMRFPAMPEPEVAIQLSLQYQLEASQWWPADALRAMQLRQLGPLIRHAASTVPFYQQLYRQHGIELPRPLTIEAFGQLPVARRDLVQEAGDGMLSKQLPVRHKVRGWETTSGSTGHPVRIAHSEAVDRMWLAFAFREHFWHQRNFMRKIAAIRWYARGTAEPPLGQPADNWGSVVNRIYETGPSASLNISASLDQQINWLRQVRPDYLMSFPSNLIALVRYAVDHDIQLPPLRQLRTIGETLPASTREFIEQHWPCNIADIYSCEETGYMATQCPQTGHYHVQSENVLLEIVDEHGRPCQPGQPGEVLVTSLNNFATPLIRYQVGDIAEFGEPCSCGRGLPVIRRVLGRKRNRLIMPSGESRFPYLGEHGSIKALTGVTVNGFQAIQHTTNEIEIKLVVEQHLTSEQEQDVARMLQTNLGHDFDIRFTYLQEIPRGRNGKFEDFISHVQA